jgi:hypothetical protein
MRARHLTRIGLLALASLAALLSTAGGVGAYTPGCGQIPIVHGIPPWGFHTGPYTHSGSFARGHGHINLARRTVSGIVCQETQAPNHARRAITMTVGHHLLYYSHVGVMWGYPGNLMKIKVRVVASNDPKCTTGTTGRATIFGSYNGVRSDSVRFTFEHKCRDQDHLYHGPQVNNQVPPR